MLEWALILIRRGNYFTNSSSHKEGISEKIQKLFCSKTTWIKKHSQPSFYYQIQAFEKGFHFQKGIPLGIGGDGKALLTALHLGKLDALTKLL